MTASDERGRAPGYPPGQQQAQPAQPHAQGVPMPDDQQQQGNWQQTQPQPQPDYAAVQPGFAPQAQMQPFQQPAFQQPPTEPQQQYSSVPGTVPPPQEPPQPFSEPLPYTPPQQAAPPTDIYGQPGGYHYPQETNSSVAQQHNAPQAEPQFDTYQPPQPVQQAPVQPTPVQPAGFEPQAMAFDQSQTHGFEVGSYAAPAAATTGQAWNEPQPAADPYAGTYQPQAYQPETPQSLQEPSYQTPAYDNNGGFQGNAAYADPTAADPQGYQPPQMAHDQGGLEAIPHGHDLDDRYGDEYDDEMYDEPSHGRRSMVVIGALIGAIAVGGGLAYGYKSVLGSGSSGGASKVVRSQVTPAKVKPTKPGGKKFANRDSKVLGRLSDSGGKTASGSRKVSTLSIGRDGVVRGGGPPSRGAPAANNSEAAGTGSKTASVAAPAVAVPGVSVVDAFAGSSAAAEAGSRSARKSVETVAVTRTAAAKTAARPIVVAETRPAKVAPRAKKPPTKAPPAQLGGAEVKPKPKRVRSRKVAARTRTPAKSKPSAGGRATRNGYVAVLASVPVSSKSRVNALTQYANIQQKYEKVLGGRKPDVVEADLGAKGKYHRLLVGPPGSRKAASKLCAKLKAAGYSGCWITAY